MTNKSYRRGYYYEWRVMKLLEEKGLVVFRCSRSKPFDLIGFDTKRGIIYLIECKRGTSPLGKNQYKKQMEIYNKLKDKFNVRYIVIRGKKLLGSRVIYMD